jgi:hypothetical protein
VHQWATTTNIDVVALSNAGLEQGATPHEPDSQQ